MRRLALLALALPAFAAPPATAATTVSVTATLHSSFAAEDGAIFVTAACVAHADGLVAATTVRCGVEDSYSVGQAPWVASAATWFGATEYGASFCFDATSIGTDLTVYTMPTRCVTVTEQCPSIVIIDNGTLHCFQVVDVD